MSIKELWDRGLIIPIFIILLFIILLCKACFSDVLEIPASCFPKTIQSHFAEYKYKVDLSPNERDAQSWAYLNNLGMKFQIITYYPVSDEEFELLREISISLMEELQRIENENCRQ